MKSIINFISSLFGGSSTPTPLPVPNQNPVVDIPIDSSFDVNVLPLTSRPSNALSGTEFVNSIMNVGPTQQREDIIMNEVLSGNVPDFFRKLKQVKVTSGTDTIFYYVTPDYICVGSDSDYVRVPLTPLTAQKIADKLDCNLPTVKMVDDVFKAATQKLYAQPWGPPYDASMQSTQRFYLHNKKIEEAHPNHTLGEITAGHKKNIVVTEKLSVYPNNVAIYGWMLTGGPIQGLNPRDHNNSYKDYSHGIRLISRSVIVNDKPMDLVDVLKDKKLSALLSNEGPFNTWYRYKV